MPDLSKYLDNQIWRLRNLYCIIDKSSKQVLFKRNNIQKLLDEDANKKKIILKARQVGVSTNELIKLLDYTLWNRNVTTCILAHEQDAIEKLFRIVRRAYEFMPKQFQPEIDRGGGSKYEMFFPGINSRIYCDLESRGDTIHRLHISEAAFVDDPQRMLATMEAVPIDGVITMESTANGMGNYFYQLWQEPGEFSKLFFPWFFMPEYSIPTERIWRTDEEEEFSARVWKQFKVRIHDRQLLFRRSKQAQLKNLFPQEYPEDDQSCFLSTGASALDLLKVKAMIDNAWPHVSKDDTLTIYEGPRAGGIYVIGADCAEGVGKDFNAAVVIEARSMKVVAVLHGHFRPEKFAVKLKDLGARFEVRNNYPLLAVERNNHGHAVLLALKEVEASKYPIGMIFEDRDERLGWLTDRISRPLMIDAFRDAIENARIQISDKKLLNECLTLVDNKGKIEAAEGYHDDLVIASCIALQMALKHSKMVDLYDNIGSKIRV